MNRRISTLAALVCLMFFCGGRVFGQLTNPVPPVNIIIDSDMSNSADDVGDHAVMWALANRGEVNVLAEICSSANDFSAPLMHAIATYYGHPNVLIGAHQGTTPTLENSANSNYTQQMVARFGIPGDTRANYPDAVTVYRQALAGAPDHSVYIVANGYWQPLQGLLQSPADSISALTGVQLVAQKVVRLVPGAGFFPSGNEHDMRVDADAASFVYANWPVEIVNVGVEVSEDVFTGPDFSSSTTTDPIKASYIQFNGGNSIPGFGQLPLLFAVRGLGSNFTVPGLNGQTTIENFSQPTPGQNNWFSTPQVGDSYLAKQATAAQLEAILNPLLQSSSNMPILNAISPSSVPAGSGQTITLTGTNFFSDSQAQFNGSNRPTTFVSATQLSVQLSSTDLQAGQQALTVANSEGGGWTSNPQTLTVTGTRPTLTSISPASAAVGSGPITLTATGANFVSASAVQVNGANRATTFVSSTQLTGTLTAGDTSTAGSLSITVNTPGSGTSGSLTFTVTNTPPSLTSISPNTATAGGPAFTLTATGSNFVNGSIVQVNGANRTTTFVSATQLTAAIPASDIASTGSLAIGVINPDGSTTGTVSLAVNNPLPSLTSMSPTSATAGSPGFTLTVTGSNFVSASVVQVNGANRTTSFVSNTQLTATIPASDIASAGTLSITVFTPTPGGGTSTALTFTVTSPPPSLTSISPSTVTGGGPAFTLTATGSNFVNGSIVQVNGANRTTTFVSATQLTAAIPASDIASAGNLSVTVFTPAPGGGTSAAVTLAVTNPQPTLTSMTPASVIAGSAAFTLTLNGSNFVSGSLVQVNGSARTTTFVSTTQLTATIPASDVASAGNLSITVNNAAPGGGTSSALSLAVNNPAPSMSSISPASVSAGRAGFTLTVNGSNFVSGSLVQVNGSARTTTFVSSTQLTASIPASDVASPGNLSITVNNAAPGGGTSSPLTLAVVNPAPSLSNISPNSTTAGSGAFTLTVNGGNFVSGSVVQVNGSTRTTTFVSSTQLKAAIPASDAATGALLSITVFTPSPGGGTSTSVTFTVNNPAPSISSISPALVIALGGNFTLTVNGSGFIPGSVVQYDGSPRPTTFVSATKVTAQISSHDIIAIGQHSVTVVNPAPGGGTSNSATLTVASLL